MNMWHMGALRTKPRMNTPNGVLAGRPGYTPMTVLKFQFLSLSRFPHNTGFIIIASNLGIILSEPQIITCIALQRSVYRVKWLNLNLKPPFL